MNKQIFILNGTAGAGKDTFAELLNKYIPTKHISSIVPIKEAAKALGWSGKKTDEYRKFLCELKKFVNSQGNFIWNYLDEQVDKFRKDDNAKVLLIDIREPEEIKKAVERYKAKTILILRYLTEIKNPYTCSYLENDSNSADQNVREYKYDYIIKNPNDITDFDYTICNFAENVISPLFQPLSNKDIAVDFDNTIAKTKYPEIIAPIGETIEFLRKAKENGATIILWTCRESEDLDDAVKWCRENNVPIDYVNENDPVRTEWFGNDSRKIGADLYIDDKSFSLWHDRRNQQDLMKFLTGEEWKFDKNV